jgi:hypothetical protein
MILALDQKGVRAVVFAHSWSSSVGRFNAERILLTDEKTARFYSTLWAWPAITERIRRIGQLQSPSVACFSYLADPLLSLNERENDLFDTRFVFKVMQVDFSWFGAKGGTPCTPLR